MNLTTLTNAIGQVSNFGEGIENLGTGEKITFSLQVVLIGMGVVFGVLLILIGVLQVFKLFAVKPEKVKKAESVTTPAPATVSASTPATSVAATSSPSEEEKIVAIATAAIAASRGKDNVDFNVISFAPIGTATPVPTATPASTPAVAPSPAPAPVTDAGEKTVSLSSAMKPASADGEKVNAPLPGNILDVKVANGASVKKGDILCILEAMKMENEIVAPVDGTIVSLVATKGSSVNTGDLLFVIG